MHRFLPVGLALLAACSSPDPGEEPPCQFTSQGWICQDGGMPQEPADADDAGTSDVTRTPDTGADVAQSQDVSSVQDVAQDTAPPPPPKSCVELRDRGMTASGSYEIFPLDPNTPVRVYCDMETQGGGWILVARSVAGGGGEYGWRTAVGNVDDDGAPYSLGMADLPFTEILVANHAGGKAPGDRIYVMQAPENFWAGCRDNACNVTPMGVVGPCQSPQMLRMTGHNALTDRYYFRDFEDPVVYGLFPGGWSLEYADCLGGEIHQAQGVIYVR